jgi:hypothetical protein
VVEPLSRKGVFGALLEQLTAAPSAPIVVVGVGRSDLADMVRQARGQPVTYLEATVLAGLDFYEPPIGNAV